MRRKAVSGTVLTLLLTSMLASAFNIQAISLTTAFIPIGTGISHVYNGIPFEIITNMLVVGSPDTPYPYATDTISLTGYTADKIHIIQHASYADNVPDGVTVGHINIYYKDGTLDTLDLIMGINIAEWAYDRPELQPYLQHTKIPPAYSFWTNIDSAYYYWGHYFYVFIDVEEKPLDYLQLVLDPASYTNQTYYGYASPTWFAIAIDAITIETPPVITVTIDIDSDTLNLKSRGKWITSYIELPEGYNVADINVSTLMLNETISAELRPIAIRDYDNDAIPDLMVKFDRAKVISYILANVNMTELIEKRSITVTLTITGKLYNGTPFQGSDTIRIIMPMPRGLYKIFPI